MEIHQFVAPSPPFQWWGDNAPDFSGEVVRLNVEIVGLRARVAELEAKLRDCEKPPRDVLDMD